jgi:alkylated DNA repair dioxygenase AlkB
MDLFSNDKSFLPFALPSKEGYNFFWNERINMFEINVPNGKILYSIEYFDSGLSDSYLRYFLANSNGLDCIKTDWRSFEKEKLNEIQFLNIGWHHDAIRMYGKDVFLPRYSAWHGDSDKPYTYSGLTLNPKPWNPVLLEIKQKIEFPSSAEFNSVLLNWYRDGSDYIGWHADAERELGKNPIIGSVNFGATRTFQIRRIDDETEKVSFPLSHGTVLIMMGELQHFWHHSVPKEKKVTRSRINLTFRKIK